MAKIVMGVGMSHSPLLALEGERWDERANDDRNNLKLNTIDGRFVPYAEVSRMSGDQHAPIAKRENFIKHYQAAQAALDRLAEDIDRIRPDVVVIIGDDHYELFSPANMPAIAVFHGEKITTHPWPDHGEDHWRNTVAKGYAMDAVHTYSADPAFGTYLIGSLIEKEFDVGSAARVDDPNTLGFGHAFGFVIDRIFGGRDIPVVPILLNTYFKPNAPTPKRCYDFGVALKKAIEEYPKDVRVAVIASGGLSHFIVEEELDRRVIDALLSNDADDLRRLPVDALNSGSSEIRCWIAAAPILANLKNQWIEYIPARRTEAGTGIGLGFGTWT